MHWLTYDQPHQAEKNPHKLLLFCCSLYYKINALIKVTLNSHITTKPISCQTVMTQYAANCVQCSELEAPVETIDHLQVAAEIFLSEVFQHPRIDQTLHECAAILR